MTKDLTKGSPAKVILLFTLPLIAGNIFQQMYAVVDTLLVGRFLGVEALAAVGCTGALMFLMIGFVMGATTGITIKTGQYFGAKDARMVRRSTATCVVICIGLSLILSIGGYFACRPILQLMQTPPEIMGDAVSFISVVYGGISQMVFFAMQTNLIRVLGDSRTPTVMLAFSLIINIILEPIVLLWLKWGVSGAAMATIAAQFSGNMACLWFIWRRLPDVHAKGDDWRVTWPEIADHLKLGLTMGSQTAIVALGAIIVQVALNGLGPIPVAAYSAAQKVDMIFTMPIISFGMAMAAYTAQNYGAHAVERIKTGVRKCALMSGAYSIFAGVINLMFGDKMMELFVGAEERQVIEMGYMLLTITSFCYIALELIFVFRNALQGLGQTVVPSIAVVVELIIRFLAAVYLVEWYGYLGVCLSMPLAWIGSVIPLALAWWQTEKVLCK